MMKRLILTIALILSAIVSIYAQEQEAVKGIAILKPVDKVGDVKYGIKLNLIATLTYAINHMPGYAAYDRVNLDGIMDEQKFQRSGFVDDNQIKQIGKATGAQYILIAEVAYFDEKNLTVTASIIDIETTRIKESSDPVISPIDPDGMRNSCIKIARSLLGMDDKVISGKANMGGNAQRGKKEQTYTVNGVSFTMISVEGGTFQMGSTTGDSDEQPVHQVTVSSFSIGQTEVTQELWQAVMGSNPSYYKGSKLPVETVCWYDCQIFITKLNQLTGKTFRLPTEAEWEFAARGGNKSNGYTYSGSNEIYGVAWYVSNDSDKTHDVASRLPNELGLYDMSGNVWEWCQDWYDSYGSRSQTNPTGPSSGSSRVERGGSWGSYASFCRVANRGYDTPTDAYYYLGFRLAQ